MSLELSLLLWQFSMVHVWFVFNSHVCLMSFLVVCILPLYARFKYVYDVVYSFHCMTCHPIPTNLLVTSFLYEVLIRRLDKAKTSAYWHCRPWLYVVVGLFYCFNFLYDPRSIAYMNPMFQNSCSIIRDIFLFCLKCCEDP